MNNATKKLNQENNFIMPAVITHFTLKVFIIAMFICNSLFGALTYNIDCSLSAIQERYPLELSENEELALLINGELQPSSFYVERLNNCNGLLLVDGGGNHFVSLIKYCERKGLCLKVKPLCLIGDLDSITAQNCSFLQQRYPNMQILKLRRDKDYTDLEAALKLIKIDKVSNVTLFGALGGRLDQTLGNLLYLYRQPYQGKVAIITPEEKLFVATKNSPLKCKNCLNKFITPLPFYGILGDINLSPIQQKAKGNSYSLNDHDIVITALNSDTLLSLSTQPPPLLSIPPQGHYNFQFNRGSQANDLEVISYALKHPAPFTIETEKEWLFVIPSSGSYTFEAILGQTISLIPLNGPATGIDTKGLHWQIQDGTLDKNFIGISNLATDTEVTVSCRQGHLLCIVNKDIDESMLNLLASSP